MPWWAYGWIAALLFYSTGVIWNDRYEKRLGLATWVATANVLLNIFFILAWYLPDAAAPAAVSKSLAMLSIAIILWHGSSGFRQVRKANPDDYLPLQHQTLLQINALTIPVQALIFGPSIALAIRAAL